MPDKIDKIEKDKRIRIVMEWILEDWPSNDIVAQIVSKWGLSERHAKRYIAEARAAWTKNEDQKVEHQRKLKIESLKKLKRSLKDQHKGTPLGIRAILAVEREIIKLQGLNPATKVEITGKNGKPIQTENVNVSVSLTSEEIKQFAKELEEEV